MEGNGPLFMVLWRASGSHATSLSCYQTGDSLARFFLFILSLFPLVIITFCLSAFSARTSFRYFSVLITISRPTTKKGSFSERIKFNAL
jgi:hypothetical protein